MILKRIVSGEAKGKILKSSKPINFLGAVDNKTGVVRDAAHDLFGKSLKDSMLVFPHGAGSSVGAYTIYSLKSEGAAPKAMVCLKADLTVASGCALADIPLVIVDEREFGELKNGQELEINEKGIAKG